MRRFLLPFALGLALPCALMRAEPSTGEAAVVGVQFSLAQPPNAAASNPWHETTVILEARPGADDPGRMLSRVRVSLLIGCEIATANKRTEYYRAQGELVALAPGRAEVRFYLPPEIVRRDSVRGEPRFWVAEVSVAGRSSQSHERVSASLTRAAARQAFNHAISREAARNDGILVAQPFTPFAWDHPAGSPTFVRSNAK